GAPIVGVGHKRNVVTLDPFLEHVGASAVGGDAHLGRVAAIGIEVSLALDGEHTEGNLRQEGGVGCAQGELDGVLIYRLDRLKLPAVVAVRGRERQAGEGGGGGGRGGGRSGRGRGRLSGGRRGGGGGWRRGSRVGGRGRGGRGRRGRIGRCRGGGGCGCA